MIEPMLSFSIGTAIARDEYGRGGKAAAGAMESETDSIGRIQPIVLPQQAER